MREEFQPGKHFLLFHKRHHQVKEEILEQISWKVLLFESSSISFRDQLPLRVQFKEFLNEHGYWEMSDAEKDTHGSMM